MSNYTQYSIENLTYSYGHSEAYEATAQDQRYDDLPYEPHPSQGADPTYYDNDDDGDDDGTRPILHNDADSRITAVNDQPQSWSAITEVPGFKGNLVLDCPVPKKLSAQLSPEQLGLREFTHMRYSAATCDPMDFLTERFTLRQTLYQNPRAVELFIVITMYNEGDDLLARTLIGVFQNINYMENSKKDSMWGTGSWRKIVVCIVSDGAEKINKRSRALLAGLGVYQAGVAKGMINKKPTAAHVYEVCSSIKV
jgi:chitin synthase